MDTHAVGLKECRIIDGDIIQTFLAVAHRQLVVQFGSQEEVIAAELGTEHNGDTEAEHVTLLYHLVKQVVIFSSVGQVNTGCLEAVGRSRVEEAEVKTGLKTEMSVFEAVGKIQTCAAATCQRTIGIIVA